MLSKGELGLTILVPVIVGAGLLYVFYLFQTGRGCDCTMMAGGVWGSSRRRAAEDAALQEMTELKQMFSQLTEAQKKKQQQRQAKSHDGVSADSGTTENVADVPNDQRDGAEEEMANQC
jgi:hypothetical protein